MLFILGKPIKYTTTNRKLAPPIEYEDNFYMDGYCRAKLAR